MKKQILKLEELPLRSEKLSSSEIQNVFGGCAESDSSCEKDSDCCSGLLCGIFAKKCYLSMN